MAKPRKHCGLTNHSTTFCFTVPRKSKLGRKAIKRIGKYGSKWLRYRTEWFKNNPPDRYGFYTCYLCGDKLHPNETTLDHILPRSSHPELRFIDSNIAPCCYLCNMKKGSKKIKE